MKPFLVRLVFFFVTSFVLLNVLAQIYGLTSRRQIERDAAQCAMTIERLEGEWLQAQSALEAAEA